MTVFGYDITPQVREDAVFVIAIALLLNGVGTLITKAFDSAAPLVLMDQFEQRLQALEKANHE